MSDLPNAQDSERAVLAECFYNPRAMTQALQALSDDDWFNELHAEIWKVMRALFDERATIDPIAVASLLKRQVTIDLVVALSTSRGDPDLAWHLERIIEAASRRRTLEAGQRLVQRSTGDVDPIEVIEQTIAELRLVQAGASMVEPTESDFLDVVARPINQSFVIPGILAKGDRLVLTAPEGWGKSSLLRQIATCSAAGIHAFNPRALIQPVQTLVVDAENPEEVNSVEYRRLYDALTEMNRLPGRGKLLIEESGPLNLLDSRQAAKLYTMVERVQPKLITIGPLYQLHESDPNEEGPARKLSAVLDRIRAISGAALITEAHSPHGDGRVPMLRPIGASLWKRWPEFGLCLLPATPHKDATEQDIRLQAEMRESRLVPWRGARATRKFPRLLGVGQMLPWESYDQPQIRE